MAGWVSECFCIHYSTLQYVFPSGNAHHVIQHIRKDGLIGQQGILQEGDEILEVS